MKLKQKQKATKAKVSSCRVLQRTHTDDDDDRPPNKDQLNKDKDR